jgi:CheY-like chemotaxis protein
VNRILLVEDNQDDVDLTLLAFQRSKLINEVVVARDGVEALALLHGTAGTPPAAAFALVLLDLKLPRVDGFEVLKRMREHPATRLVPVVVLTSSAQERDLVRTYSIGANSYIVKPVDFEQFLVSAQQIGMYWLLLNSNPPEVADVDANPVH